MRRSALTLVAHGSPGNPSADATIHDHAQVLARCTPFDRVTVAFHCKQPSVATALRRLSTFDVTVVPFMTSEGYFTTKVLPRERSKDIAVTPRQVGVTPPVGTHPQIVSLVARRVRHQIQRFNLNPSATSLAVIGHGTRCHERSRQATLDLATALHRKGVCSEVFPAFLQGEPHVRTITDPAREPDIIVVPFMMTCGRHVTRDIPEDLGLTSSPLPGAVAFGRVKTRFVVCDAPIGTDPGIVEIVADLARRHGAAALGEVA